MAQEVPSAKATLVVEHSVEGGAWRPLDPGGMQSLEDGGILMPSLDRRQEFRLGLRVESATETHRLPAGRASGEGTFFTVEQLHGAGEWRQISSSSLSQNDLGFEMPLDAQKGIWRLKIREIPPEPTPGPPLLIAPNPVSLFGSGPKPFPVPGGGPMGSFDETPGLEPFPRPGPNAFNQYIFEERIQQLFEGDVKGYAVVIANSEGFQGRVAGGWARDPADPKQGGRRMSTTRPSNIGSCAKLYSGVALMRLLEERGPDFQITLDLPVAPFLPLRWQSSLAAEHNLITFRMLLNHTSGILDLPTGQMPDNRKEHPDFFHFTNPLGATQGCNNYANENYRIMTFLVARLAVPGVIQDLEEEYENANFEVYLDEIRDCSGLEFEKYMEEKFFPLIDGSFAPSCDPAKDYTAGNTALMYSSPNDTLGLQWSQKELAGFCRGQGGYWSSAHELARFMSAVRYTGDLLKPVNAQLLISAPGTVGGPCPGSNPWLITNGSTSHVGFQAELGVNSWRDKPGRQPSGLDEVGTGRAEAMFLPYDWVCATVMNSDTLSDPDGDQGLTTPLILDAFYEATRDLPVTISREAMTMPKFLVASSELRTHGMEVRWLDCHDIDGTPYVNAVFGEAPEPVAGLVGMNSAEYQNFLNEWVTEKGFAVQQVESYLDHGKLRYGAIISEEDRPDQSLYHGYTAEMHAIEVDTLKNQGYVPINVSVVSFNGVRRYTALYEKRAVKFKTFSQLTSADYQATYDSLYSEGYRVVSLNAYRHQGQIYYAGIWHQVPGSNGAVHDAGRDRYRSTEATEYQKNRVPVILTGVDSGNQTAPVYERHTFGSIWK